MTLVKFNPVKKASTVNPWFTDVFESVFNDAHLTDRLPSRVPAINIAETDADFQIELAAPGLKKENFKINIEKTVLSISAERKNENAEESKKYSKREFSYASFTRSFNLPETIDHQKIDAAYTDGVLKLTIAKKEEAKVQAREIAVQ
ncbi:MAG: Hsp20/alpha crystallin family protein [Sphingobacteriaceae bacterium]|nr:MAG: Hsp20/alpha crystallin family protein [Sphingobacteriaceae bacterium]